MHNELPSAGAAGPELAAEVHEVWLEAARRAGRDASGFDASAPLPDRIAWAESCGLTVAAVLSRYSRKMQHSTGDQVRECVAFASAQGFYTPPEYVCVDEGRSGRKLRRDGLERMRTVIGRKLAKVLLVFKVSRLLRAAYKGYQLFNEELVERGLRGISVSQGIDTDDEETWEVLMVIHGLSDKMLLKAMSDHVRASLVGLARQGFTIGALTVGYRPREVPGARPANSGAPRTVPDIDPDVAPHIRRAFERVRDGMSLRDARRLYIAEGGPADSRSTTGRMSPEAFRRLLANPRYTGCWAFGRFKSVWSNSRDYVVRIPRPEAEVVIVRNEELRIVDDGLFYAVQGKLAKLKRHGPTGPKTRKEPKLWDCVVDCFYCGECDARCYLNGGDKRGMRCKNGPDCPKRFSLRREAAVRAVCDALTELVKRDAGLVAEVVAAARRLDAAGEERVRADLEKLRRRIATLAAKIDELEDLAGEGDAAAREARRAKIRAAEQERAALRAEEVRLKAAIGAGAAAVTPERVRQTLADMAALLTEGAAGRLASDEVYLAAEAFRRLVGGRIEVQVAESPGRKRHPIRGAFFPELLRAAREEFGLPAAAGPSDPVPVGEVEVWLREPWPHDRLADRIGTLVEAERLKYAEVVGRLAGEGITVSELTVGRIYRRFRERRTLTDAAAGPSAGGGQERDDEPPASAA